MITFEQTVPALREHRVMPNRIVNAQFHEPAEQQVELQSLHQLALRTYRVKRLQQGGSQQLLRRDRRPSGAYIAAKSALGSDNAAFTQSRGSHEGG